MKINNKIFAALLSILSNTLLVIVKLIVGILSGSVSIMSEAIHSGIDLLASCIACIAVSISSKPADVQHQYGHGKFEDLSGFVEALLIFIAAIWIIYEAIHKLISPQPIEKLDFGILIMGGSAFLNLIVSNYLIKIGKETDSIALIADAWHLRTDVYTSAGVMLSLTVLYCNNYFFPHINLNWIDPITGIAVAVLIIHAAYKLVKQASYELVDVSLPANELEWLCDYINSLAPMVRGFNNLRTRKAGAYRFIELNILVDGNMTINVSHSITKKIITKVKEHFVGAYIIIQVEPYNEPFLR